MNSRLLSMLATSSHAEAGTASVLRCASSLKLRSTRPPPLLASSHLPSPVMGS